MITVKSDTQNDRPQIVVVDDDSIALENVRRKWSNLDVELILFDDPLKAISHMATQLPTLIFVDLFMPRLDGIELLSLPEFEHYPIKHHAILHSAVTPSEEILARAHPLGVEIITKELMLSSSWVSQKIASTNNWQQPTPK